jgi:ATP-dependent helicase HrpA
MAFFRDLDEQIAQAMQSDRHRLKNALRGIRRLEEQGQPFDSRLEDFWRNLEESIARRRRRVAARPVIKYDPGLPVVSRKPDILAAIRDHQVVVLCGETGSGKSTQLPKICLELGRGIDGMIGHTQPRRIAARSVAARLAEEMETKLGAAVGYKVRFTDQTAPETLVKVMTDGVLLAESQHDRFFDQYDTLIIDEAHERSLNIDFLLGYLHRLLPKRPDLKLIITSATIDAARFAEHFLLTSEGRATGRSALLPIASGAPEQAAQAEANNAEHSGQAASRLRDAPYQPAPILEVSGRTYPVEVLYRPLAGDEDTGEVDQARGVVQAVEEIAALGRGDILAFLPTERDILDTHQKLRALRLPEGELDILPLYARLSAEEQQRVFQPHRGRRVVLSTNVAESSLTVPGIHYVVDTGTARISRYSPRSKVQRLPIEPVSQASADQRKGRCGRLGPGVCVRLFSEDDYLSRDRFTAPEIQRTNLAAVILQTHALNLGPIDEFPFLDPPRGESIRDGYKTLFEIGAIDEHRALTPIGKQLAKLPCDPRIGRMILAAAQEHCLADVLVIAAALEIQDPRERPASKQQAADEAQAKFADPDSDFLSYLKLWDFYHRLKKELSRNQLRRACQQNFLSYVRLREWQDIHRQLLDMATQLGLKAGPRRWGEPAVTTRQPAGEIYAAVHRALLTGLLSNVALRSDAGEYTGVGNQRLALWPGSGVFGQKPKWIVAADLIETTRRYARTAARIDPGWLEALAPHLVHRSYADPHWDRRAGSPMAWEKVTLFGLTIVPRRRIRLASVDPRAARDVFIREGLAAGELDSNAGFYAHNQRLLEEIAKLAAKTRRRDLMVDPETVADFYLAHVPQDVFDASSLFRWLRKNERTAPKALYLREEDLFPSQPLTEQNAAYPDTFEIGALRLPVDYRFEPGAAGDGVTVTVPKEGLKQLSPDRLGWLVPGLLEDKVQALIRTLPKPLRRNLVPAPEVARRAIADLGYGQGPFLPAVATALSRIAGENIPETAFDLTKLPEHLQLNVRVVDERGQTVAEGRDVHDLREKMQVATEEAAPAPAASAHYPWQRDDLLRWDFGELPAEVNFRFGAVTVIKHPAVVDLGETAGLRPFDSAAEASEAQRGGLRRLLAIVERREIKAQVAWLPEIEKMRLWGASLTANQSLEDQLTDLIAERALQATLELRKTRPLPRSATEFAVLRTEFAKEIVPAVQATTKVVLALLEAYHQVRLALAEKYPAHWDAPLADLREQFAALLPERFLSHTPWAWLQHYPRYLRGMLARIGKLKSGGVPKDQQLQAQVTPRWQQYEARRQQHRKLEIHDPELERYRWLLEEFRVSLFAQELGTSQPVSPQRLDKQWGKVK